MKLAKITKRGIKTRLLIIGILLITYFNINMYFNHHINSELNRLKKDGEITHLKELVRAPVRGDNRANLYFGAGEILDIKRTAAPPLDGDIIKYYETNKDKIKVEMERNRIALDIMDRVSTKSKFSFNLDYEKGFAMKVPNYLQLRSLAQLLEMKAIDEINSGNYEQAVIRCAQCLALGRDIGEENGCLINHMISIAIIRIGTAPLDYMMKNHIVTDYRPAVEQLNLIKGSLNTGFIKSLEAERAAGINFYELLSSNEPVQDSYLELGPLSKRYSRIIVKPYILADKLYYIKYMSNLIDQVQKNPSGEINQPELSKYYIFSKILTPSIKRAAEQNTKIVNKCNELSGGLWNLNNQ
ncbi:MAG: hypothetical protein ABRQ38_06190 [Candidatus Eremiobacterota bacterium]